MILLDTEDKEMAGSTEYLPTIIYLHLVKINLQKHPVVQLVNAPVLQVNSIHFSTKEYKNTVGLHQNIKRSLPLPCLGVSELFMLSCNLCLFYYSYACL